MALASIEQVKRNELDIALRQAQGEIVLDVQLIPHATTVSVSQGRHVRDAALAPLDAELQQGFLIQSTNPDVMDANLILFSEEGSDIVQLAFRRDIEGADKLSDFAPALAPDGSTPYTLGFCPVGAPVGGTSLRASGLKQWILHAALKVATRTVTDAIEQIARVVEERAKPHPSFISMQSGYQQPADAQCLSQAKNKRVLLFVHGIFSSIEGGFHALGEPGGNSTLQQLLGRYENNVFGYDHWTISKTPSENAIDLLEAIPEDANWIVDLVCHSRGGLVTRTLLADVEGGQVPKTEELRRIVALRTNKIAGVGKVLFVAGANQGSPLADQDDIQRFLKVVAVLASKSQCFALDVVIGLLRTLLSAAYALPSIQQLDSVHSQLIGDLNLLDSLMDKEGVRDRIYGVRANFDRAGWTWKEAAVLLENCLMPEINDMVVPYAGVAKKPFIPDVDSRMWDFNKNSAQSAVWHTSYFDDSRTHDFLLQTMTGAP